MSRIRSMIAVVMLGGFLGLTLGCSTPASYGKTDTMKGDTMKGDGMKGDGMKGDGMKSDKK